MAGVEADTFVENGQTTTEEDESDAFDEFERKSRVKRKTEKGQAMYDDVVRKYLLEFDTVWSDIEDITVKVNDYKSQSDFKALGDLDKQSQALQVKQRQESEDFLEFLSRTNTAESMSELRIQEVLHEKCQDIMKELSRKIREARIEVTDRLSQRGSNSLCTRSEVGETSETSGILAKKRMEMEAHRARLLYEARELKLRKEKASLAETEAKQKAEQIRRKEELDAEFLFLEQERNLAVAEAEVKALENTGMSSRHVSPAPSLLGAPIDRKQLTAKCTKTVQRIVW